MALAATYGVYVLLERAKESSRVATAPVIVAMQDVPEGGQLTRAALATEHWPVAVIPANAFRSADSVVGRVARIPVFKGEAILEGRLAPVGTGPGLEIKINPGKRAMAVRINDVAGISGLIQPNSRVDVLLTTLPPGSTDRSQQIAKLFMENMRVLSVGTQVERGQDGRPIHATTATLEVEPDEAERLAVAIGQGTIQLVLRGYGDPDSVATRGATSADVLARLRPAPTPQPPAPRPQTAARRAAAPPPAEPPAVLVSRPPPAQPETTVVQVYRGSTLQQQKFEKGDSIPPRTP